MLYTPLVLNFNKTVAICNFFFTRKYNTRWVNPTFFMLLKYSQNVKNIKLTNYFF